MRVDAVTLEAVRKAVAPLDTAERREAYRTGQFPRADVVRDLDKRYRWDLWHRAQAWRVLGDDVDLTNEHIDTALRRIVPPLVDEEA